MLAATLVKQLEWEVQRHKEQQARAAALVASVDSKEVHPMKLLCEGIKQGKVQGGITAFVKALWPALPEGVMQDLIPGPWDTKGLPFNRRKRPSLQRSSGLFLHLFSGQQRWSLPRGDLWEVDLLQGSDLLSPDLYAFILELGCSGTLDAVIGGPPCRTTSRLRAADHPLCALVSSV